MCAIGSSSGSSIGTCPTWHWNTCPATPSCSATSCSDCVSTNGCGWCSDTSTCSAGSVEMPETSTCSDWHWDACPSEVSQSTFTLTNFQSCSASSCAECVLLEGCGWCIADSETCTEGYLDSSDNCGGSWSYTSCATVEDSCNENDSCDSCFESSGISHLFFLLT